MKTELKADLKKISINFLLKGVLVSIGIFVLAMIVNSVILGFWYAYRQNEISTNQLVITGILAGVYPIAVYIIIGIVRSIKVILKEIVVVVIIPAIEKYMDKLEKEKFEKMVENNDFSSVILEVVYEKLRGMHGWMRKLTEWLLSKVNISIDLLSLGENGAYEEIKSKILEYLEEVFENTIDALVPFWIRILIPVHLILLVVIWFI